MSEQPTFEGWSVIELMGHRRLVGHVRAEEIAGHGMLRLDMLGPDGTFTATQYYSPSALYCLTPTTEEMARSAARLNQVTPIQRWELQLAERVNVSEPDGEPF